MVNVYVALCLNMRTGHVILRSLLNIYDFLCDERNEYNRIVSLGMCTASDALTEAILTFSIDDDFVRNMHLVHQLYEQHPPQFATNCTLALI